MDQFDTISPIDYRYYGDNKEVFVQLHDYLSEEANIKYLLRVELAIVRVLAANGVCPAQVPEQVEAACREITASDVYAEENRVHHNIRALVNCIRRKLPRESWPYVHLFATSNDIMDTAAALRYKDFVRDVVLPDLIDLSQTLVDLARRNSGQAQIGRTHGQHAIPTTFGSAIALYVSRLGSRIQSIYAASQTLRGKFSGAVGAFNALSLHDDVDPVRYEIELMNELGLKASDCPVASQIVEPEYLADLVYSIVSCFSVLANLADDVRNLVRTEIGELTDTYRDEEVGSSTMPHKINPKNFENIKSLWKEFMPRMNTMFMDQISEHQRDLTNSASQRFLPELFAGFTYAVARMQDGLSKIRVNAERMSANLESSKHLIVAEPLYITLALQGYAEAYDAVMRLARESQKRGVRLMDLVRSDKELHKIIQSLPEKQKKVLDDPALYIGAAEQRTIAVCDHWEQACVSMKRQLKADRIARRTLAIVGA